MSTLAHSVSGEMNLSKKRQAAKSYLEIPLGRISISINKKKLATQTQEGTMTKTNRFSVLSWIKKYIGIGSFVAIIGGVLWVNSSITENRTSITYIEKNSDGLTTKVDSLDNRLNNIETELRGLTSQNKRMICLLEEKPPEECVFADTASE